MGKKKNMGPKADKEKGDVILLDVSNDAHIEIISATIKDGLCNYRYKVLQGVGKGFTHTVNGIGVVDDDMYAAFARLKVHMAIADDIFKHLGLDIESCDDLHENEITELYLVNGFNITGSEENKSVQLIGSKHTSTVPGRLEIKGQKINMEDGKYIWYNELREAIRMACREVELYMNGKYTEIEKDEPVSKIKQISLEITEASEDFEAARM